MPGSDESPEDAKEDDSADGVARPNVETEYILLGQIRDEERYRQAPVGESDERIPYLHHGRYAIGMFGISVHGFDGAAQSSRGN